MNASECPIARIVDTPPKTTMNEFGKPIIPYRLLGENHNVLYFPIDGHKGLWYT